MQKLSVINQQFIKAAQNNRLNKLKNLLSQGANIHADADYALRWSACYGHLEIVEFLVTNGANIHANDDAALRYSAENGQFEVVRFLATKGANIHAQGDYALRYSARYCRLETVKFLVAQGANIHADNDSALRWSTYNEHYDVWRVLSAFIQEEKLLVAASDSMLVLPAVGSMLQTKQPSITKTKRSKI